MWGNKVLKVQLASPYVSASSWSETVLCRLSATCRTAPSSWGICLIPIEFTKSISLTPADLSLPASLKTLPKNTKAGSTISWLWSRQKSKCLAQVGPPKQLRTTLLRWSNSSRRSLKLSCTSGMNWSCTLPLWSTLISSRKMALEEECRQTSTLKSWSRKLSTISSSRNDTSSPKRLWTSTWFPSLKCSLSSHLSIQKGISTTCRNNLGQWQKKSPTSSSWSGSKSISTGSKLRESSEAWVKKMCHLQIWGRRRAHQKTRIRRLQKMQECWKNCGVRSTSRPTWRFSSSQTERSKGRILTTRSNTWTHQLSSSPRMSLKHSASSCPSSCGKNNLFRESTLSENSKTTTRALF